MINAKKVTIDGVEYVAVKNTTHSCNGCAFKERPSQCDKIRCTEFTNDNGVEVVTDYKWKKNEQKETEL